MTKNDSCNHCGLPKLLTWRAAIPNGMGWEETTQPAYMGVVSNGAAPAIPTSCHCGGCGTKYVVQSTFAGAQALGVY